MNQTVAKANPKMLMWALIVGLAGGGRGPDRPDDLPTGRIHRRDVGAHAGGALQGPGPVRIHTDPQDRKADAVGRVELEKESHLIGPDEPPRGDA